MKNQAGVYKITIGEEIYVGSSVNLEARIEQHKRLAETGKEALKVQEAYNRERKMHVDILEIVPDNITIWDMLQREKYWFDTLKPELNTHDPASKIRDPEHNANKLVKYLYERYKYITRGRFGLEFRLRYLENTAKVILYSVEKTRDYLRTIEEVRSGGKRYKDKSKEA